MPTNQEILDYLKKKGYHHMQVSTNQKLQYGVSILFSWAKHPGKTDWNRKAIKWEYLRLYRIGKQRGIHFSKTPSQFNKLVASH